jgi:hypothetical protein
MWKRFHVKLKLSLSDFNETWIFSTDIRKKLKHQVSSKSVQWEPNWSLWTDGQTDMTKLIVAFRNFANAPKNEDEILNNNDTEHVNTIVGAEWWRTNFLVEVKCFVNVAQVSCSERTEDKYKSRCGSCGNTNAQKHLAGFIAFLGINSLAQLQEEETNLSFVDEK